MRPISAIARAATIDEQATVMVEPTLFFAEAEEVRARMLVRVLMALGGESYPPRFERMNALHAAMRARGAGRFKRTLAGTVVEWRGGRFQFYRELGRGGLPPAPVRPGSAISWDHRFVVEFGADTPPGLMLGALGEAGRRTVGAGAIGCSPGAIASAPALWRGTSLVAAPTLSYFGKGEANSRSLPGKSSATG